MKLFVQNARLQSRLVAVRAMVICSVLSSTALAADQTGAERTKQVVSAKIVPAKEKNPPVHAVANADQIGNVQVTYADRTTDLWTAKGNCSLAQVAPDGTVGWTVNGDAVQINSADWMRPNGTLVLNRKGTMLATIKTELWFIEKWGFAQNGSQLILRSRGAHGPATFGLHDANTGRLIESAKESDTKIPKWAKPYADSPPPNDPGDEPPATSSGDAPNEYDAAADEAAKIVKEELMKRYEGEKGLLVKPMTINGKENPKLRAMDEKFGSLWKQFRPQIADAYTATVKPVNDKNSATAAKMRPSLTGAFNKAIELRGGGSGSVMMLVYAPAHVEWMIGNVGKKKYQTMKDEVFMSKLTEAINYDNSQDTDDNARIRKGLEPVLKNIKRAEAFLPDDQKGFIRAEFLAYCQN